MLFIATKTSYPFNYFKDQLSITPTISTKIFRRHAWQSILFINDTDKPKESRWEWAL